MRAYVQMRLPDGREQDLSPGDIIGRMPTAALVLDDARVSEAHALITLRAGELRLLPLRGRCAVDGELVSEATLEVDMVIEPAPGLELLVTEVSLPPRVMALCGEGMPLQVLNAVVSLRTKPVPQIVPRYVADAEAHIWAMGNEWRIRVGDGPVMPLVEGQEIQVFGGRFVAKTTHLAQALQSPTCGGYHQPLRIVARFDAVHIHRGDAPVLVLSGHAARMLSELGAANVPLDWDVLAGLVWRDPVDRDTLRRRWDMLLARLRRKFRLAGIPTDLVRANGNGLVELVLQKGDQLVDEA